MKSETTTRTIDTYDHELYLEFGSRYHQPMRKGGYQGSAVKRPVPTPTSAGATVNARGRLLGPTHERKLSLARAAGRISDATYYRSLSLLCCLCGRSTASRASLAKHLTDDHRRV